MILLELINKPYHYRWDDDGPTASSRQATFTTDDGTKVYVVFARHGERNDWILVFERTHSDNPYSSSFQITKQGDAFRVFATVGEVVNEFISKYKPDHVAFHAEEPSRARLYMRMGKLLAKKHNMDFTADDAVPGDPGTQFGLDKK